MWKDWIVMIQAPVPSLMNIKDWTWFNDWIKNLIKLTFKVLNTLFYYLGSYNIIIYIFIVFMTKIVITNSFYWLYD